MERSMCASLLVAEQLVQSQEQSPHMHRGLVEESLKVTFITESTILHQEPRLSKVGMVVNRVEEMGFWKMDFRHCVYFRSVRQFLNM